MPAEPTVEWLPRLSNQISTGGLNDSESQFTFSDRPSYTDLMDRRKEPRHLTRLPVEIDGQSGTTINISSSGVAFESAMALTFGQEITLQILIPKDGSEPLRLKCRGRIVRLEKTRRVEKGRETVSVGASVEWITNDPTTAHELFEILSDSSNIDRPGDAPPPAPLTEADNSGDETHRQRK